jgi:hypothetical protein
MNEISFSQVEKSSAKLESATGIYLPVDLNDIPGVDNIHYGEHKFSMKIGDSKTVMVSRPPFFSVGDDTFDVVVEEPLGEDFCTKTEVIFCHSGEEVVLTLFEISRT